MNQPLLDKFAVGLSASCAAHCLLLPVAIVVLPGLSTAFVADEFFHQLLLLLVIPTSVIALTLGCRKHGRWHLALCGLVGLAMLIFAALFGHNVVGETGERFVTVLGSAVIACGHLRNHYLCRQRACCR